MTRTYKRKIGVRPRIPINENNLRLAVRDVLIGKSLRGTAKRFALCVMTLKRYVKKKQAALRDKANQDIKYAPDYRKARIFTSLEEEGLKNYLEAARKSNEKLSNLNMRRLAYQYANENKKTLPLKWHDMKAATYDWLNGFMKRHISLSPKLPDPQEKGQKLFEATSPARAIEPISNESSLESGTQDETIDSVEDDREFIPPVKQETTENEVNLYVTEDETTDITKVSIGNICTKDECETFGQLIAHKLRKLSARNRLLAERRIHDIIFNLELEELDPLTENRDDRSFCFVSKHT